MTNKRRQYLADEVIPVNLSTPFLQRTKCKFCGEGPAHYYCVRETANLDVKRSIKYMEWIRKHHYRMCSDDYFFDDPKDCNRLIHFSYQILYRAYSPILHRTKGIHPRANFVEYLVCDCGKSTWVFYYRSTVDRPEIINRKSRSNFPKKFLY